LFLSEYEQHYPLTSYEAKALGVFLKVHQAITILETSREKRIEGNTTDENDKFMEKGKLGLDFVSQHELVTEGRQDSNCGTRSAPNLGGA